ncbi:MAG: CHAD domain-containing protein [Solirubrobacterales bacterium]
MAKAREISGLEPGDAYRQVAVRVVEARAAEMFDHAEGVLDIGDIERLHDMRVATRRLRAALEIFAPCFNEERFGAVLTQVKSLADALGVRRDRDVALVTFDGFAGELAAADRRGIEGLASEFRSEQASANEALVEVVSPQRLQALSDEIAELVGR